MFARIGRARNDEVMNIDLSVPIWTIEHVAAALGNLSVDAAREYTYTTGFPAARDGFARNLWLREEVLAWFAGLPAKPDVVPVPVPATARDRDSAPRPPEPPVDRAGTRSAVLRLRRRPTAPALC